MSRPTKTTTVLGLPLDVHGVVRLQNAVKRGFTLLDAAIAALQGGSGIIATEITYDSGNPGDSNSTATTVGGALDDLYSKVTALTARVTEIEGGNSNSP